MKNSILSFLFIAILIFVSGCNIEKKDFVGNEVIESKEFTDLSKDEIYTLEIVNIALKNDAINIEFIQGSTSNIKVTTDKNILDTLKITNENGIIKITGEKKYRYEITELNIEISNLKLSKYDLEGAFIIHDVIGNYDTSLDINVLGVLEGNLNLFNINEKLNVTIDGVSDLYLHGIILKNTEFKLNGTANVTAVGTSDNLNVDANGVFNLKFKDLVVKVADVKMDGTSNSSFNVTDDFSLDVNGLGNVEYYGKPSVTKITKDGLITITNK